MSDLPDLPDLWAAAWTILRHAQDTPGAPGRFAVLASTGVDGPEARTVVLRRIDQAARCVEAHTDTRSAKWSELIRDPRATLVVWDPAPAVQIRLRVAVTCRAGTRTEWAAIPERARLPYGGQPPPGVAMVTPDQHTPTPDPRRFGVLHCAVQSLDILDLSRPQHLRARFSSDHLWAGEWIAP